MSVYPQESCRPVNCLEIEGTEMTSDTSATLTAGKLRIELSPSIGGAILGFEGAEGAPSRAILRKCNSSLQNVLDASSFPLVPYVNRIRDGHFTFRGREVRLAPNMAGDPSPLHGQGGLNPWQGAGSA